MLSRRALSSSLPSVARRHFASVAAPLPAVNGEHHKPSTPTRYVPENAQGRFFIEQVSEHWRSAVAARDLEKGSIVGTAPGIFFDKPTRFTIQVSADQHLEFHGGLEYVNHSCAPNTKLVMSEGKPEVSFVALRDISEGEHLSFDYTTSEWDMEEKFDCLCGAPTCRGHIGGAKYLNNAEVESRIGMFTPSVLRQLLEKKIAN